MKYKRNYIIMMAFVLLGGCLLKEINDDFGEMNIFINNKKYCFSFEKKEMYEECILQLDYNNPKEVIGQIIYQEGLNIIKVSDIYKESEGSLRIYFDAIGNYNVFKGKGTFVTPVYIYNDKSDDAWKTETSLIKVVPESDFKCKFSSVSSVFEDYTNQFSVDIIPYDYPRITKKGETDMIKLIFSELLEVKWEKTKFLKSDNF